MPNDMIAIAESKLPAHLRSKAVAKNQFASAVSTGGFPVVSIKGKVFHVTRGDERMLVTKPGEDDEPARSLEVVIAASNPEKSKVYYAHGYEEGSSSKPDCYSNDGIAPALDAEDAQSTKCATCPHNIWGSRITDSGGKGKACADSMRLAVAPAGQLNDPMLLRVPAASLKTLGQYGGQLAKRGVDPKYVVTKIGFDYNVAHPALTFKAVRFIEEDELAAIEAMLVDEEEVVGNITGVTGAVATEQERKAEAEAPKPRKSEKLKDAEAEAEAAPKKAKVVVEDDEVEDEGDAFEAPKAKPAPKKAKAKPVVEADEDDEPEEKPVKKAKGPMEVEEKAKADAVEDYDDIDDALDNLDFDD